MASVPADLTRKAVRAGVKLARNVHAQLEKRSEPYRSAWYEEANRLEFSSVLFHEEMLASTVRMEAYRDGISRLVPDGATVLDLGTGTGIMAALAARKAGTVYAIDHSAEMLEVARRLVDSNGLSNVTLVHTHSADYAPPEPLDVIIQEQMGPRLLDEAFVPNVARLRDSSLAPNGRILPNLFNLFIEPVELHEAFRVPFIWEMQFDNISLAGLRDDPAVRDRMRWYRDIPFNAVTHVLSEPESLHHVDLETVSATSPPVTIEVRRTAVRSGSLDGLVIWFDAGTKEGVWLSTHPSVGQICWPVPLVRVPQRRVEAGDEIVYSVRLDPAGTVEVTPG